MWSPGLAWLLAGPAAGAAQTTEIEAALVHPPVAVRYQCSEHALGTEDHVPDALGADCVVVRRTGGPDGNLNALHSGDGSRNEDWYGWREPLLAPCDPDPIQVALIHVREVVVAEGDVVRAGDVVARIGNNGSSFNPHVHVGAFRGELFSDDAVPLQVRFDLAAMGGRPPLADADQTRHEAEVKAAVERFLDAAGRYDVDALEAMFAPGASIGTAALRDGRWVTRSLSADEWLAAIRTGPARPPYQEPVREFTVHVDDGQLAFVRADARLIRDGRVQSRNIDYFTLLRDADGAWKLVNGSYTTRPPV